MPKHFNDPKPFTWNGITYPSLKRASEVTGICPSQLRYRRFKGYTCDKDMHNDMRDYYKTKELKVNE